MKPVNLAIVYYSATGNVHALAEAAATGGGEAGAEVRLLRVPETAPPEAIDSRPEWAAHVCATAHVTKAEHDDLAWADAVIFGTPTRFGNPASQLRAFIDTLGPLWFTGGLVDKVYSAFTTSNSAHGGQESTLLALANTFHHWGGILVPPGYTDPVKEQANNPYGASHVVGNGAPDSTALAAAAHQARRVVGIAARLKATA